MRYRVLGPLEVHTGDGPVPLGGPRQRAVLAHLLLRRNQTVPATNLIDAVWGEEPPESARNTLQTYVSHLRKALGEGRIESRPPGYLLEVGPDELDSDRFEARLRDARRADAVADPAAAVRLLEEALALWRGPAFADLAGEPSLAGEAARLDELRLSAQEDRLDALLASGEHGAVVGEAEALLADHNLRERVWGQLMLALYRSGRQADALTAFQRAREVLADELGIDPSPELAALHERVLRQDPDLELRGEPLRGYRLLERIDEGPRATVFCAIQPKVGRDVAVKIVHAAFASDPGFVRRFEADAQAAAALEHPHVVPIYDYWREPDAAYVVSRYLRGGSLAGRATRGGATDLQAARRAIEQVGSALAFAHRQGVLHGNVDESNVLFDGEGNAYLGDFGVGRPSPVEAIDDVAALAALAHRTLGDAAPALATVLERLDRGDTTVEADDVVRALFGADEPTTPAVSSSVRNPYKGLRAFSQADARDFFGREALTGQLVDDLAGDGSRFLAVVGPSGSGKSSVVRAGLLPRLAAGALPGSETWFVAEMLPGTHPIEELESALIRIAVQPVTRLLERLETGPRGLLQAVDLIVPGDTQVLVVVDQFEEVFTLTEDDGERDRFLELLRVAVADPGSRIRVLVTLRADFFDRPLQHARFSELLARRTVAVPPLSPDELEQAISGPARRVGARVEPGLVAAIVGDVASQPGALPLVEFALTELFERRDDSGTMTADSYREIGGIAGALAMRAEHLYRAMNADGRTAARQVLLRLVTLGEGREDTRRLVTQAELGALEIDDEIVDAMLDAFGRHRLLTFDREPSTREPTVEIAHEALLREWPRLRSWIDDAREDLRRSRLLTRGAGEWRAADEDPSFLMGGARLDQVSAWAGSTTLAIGLLEREYLAASLARRERERVEVAGREAREQELERRSRSRLRTLVVVLAVAALVASTLTIVAVRQRGNAIEQTRVASARELAAAAMTSLEVDPERSILLALEAARATEEDGIALKEAVEALHAGVQRDRLLFTLDDPSTGNVAWSPSGDVLATGGSVGGNAEHDVLLWDAWTGRLLHRLVAHTADVTSVSFSNDGSLLVTTADDATAIVWDVATGEEVHRISAEPGTLMRAGSFSPDGSLLALGASTGVDATETTESAVRVFDTDSWDLVRRFPSEGAPVFSSDGEQLVSAWEVLDLATGRVVTQLPFFDGLLDPSDSSIVQYTEARDVVVLIDPATGATVDRVAIPSQGLGIAWSPDGTAFATAGSDGVARVWDAEAGAELVRLNGHAGLVGLVSFSPDGTRLLTGGGDGTARVWDVTPEGGYEVLARTEPSPLFDVDFAPDEQTLLTAGWDGGWSWDPSTGDRGTPYPSARWGATYAPDGTRLAAIAQDGTVEVLDAETGAVVHTLGAANQVAFAPDGSTVATAGHTNTVQLWDASTGEALGKELGVPLYEEPSEGVAFTPDGSLVASIGGRGTLRVWNVADRTLVGETQANSGQGRALAVDPEGEVILTGGADGVSIWRLPDLEAVGRLNGDGIVVGVTFSDDGGRVATVSEGGTTKIWDTATWQEVLTMTGSDSLEDVAFSPDDTMLATVSGDGVLRVHELDVGRLIELARTRVTRGLTQAECRQYLHQPTCAGSDLPIVGPPDGAPPATPLDGAYRTTVTFDELLEAGASRELAGWTAGDYRLSVLGGRYRLTYVAPDGWHSTTTGMVDVDGDQIVVDHADSDVGCVGLATSARWTLEASILTFSDVAVGTSSTCPDDGVRQALFTATWTRLGQLSAAG